VLGNVLKHNNVTRSLKGGQEEAKRKLQQAGHKLAVVKDDLDRAITELSAQKVANLDYLHDEESRYNEYGRKRSRKNRNKYIGRESAAINRQYASNVQMAHNTLRPALLEAEQQLDFIQQTLRAYATAIPQFEQKARNFAARGPVKYMGNLAPAAAGPEEGVIELQAATQDAQKKMAAVSAGLQDGESSQAMAKLLYDLGDVIGYVLMLIPRALGAIVSALG
jgi:vacuolar-type H+-ATPase subunit I/STV1